MRSISDTIGRLSLLQSPHDGAEHIALSDRLSDLSGFGSNPGGLRAVTYIPKGLRPGAPLVVVLHGCRQTAAAYDHGSGWSGGNSSDVESSEAILRGNGEFGPSLGPVRPN